MFYTPQCSNNGQNNLKWLHSDPAMNNMLHTADNGQNILNWVYYALIIDKIF